MGYQLRLHGQIRTWLAGLRDTEPEQARVVGEAMLALIDAGEALGPPLVVALASALGQPEESAGTILGPTKENTVAAAQKTGSASPALPDAVSKVDAYFKRNGLARMALAYYYRDYILGTVAPRTTAMIDVAIALDLSAEGTVGEFKKELQRRIWNEQHHQRELAQFLLANGLIGRPDLDRALRVAAANEASGRTKVARDRLSYRHKR